MKAVAIMTPDPKNLANVNAMSGTWSRGSFLADRGNKTPRNEDEPGTLEGITEGTGNQDDKNCSDMQTQTSVIVIAASTNWRVSIISYACIVVGHSRTKVI